jgi:hypothetical protein
MYKSFKSWQHDFIAIKYKHKFMGSIFLFFMLLVINFCFNHIAVNVFGLTESYFTNFTSQIIVPLVLTLVTYPRINKIN